MINKNKNDLLIVSGLSGAGKSTALIALEDIGYHCIDNFPPHLIDQIPNMIDVDKSKKKIAITFDIRNIIMFGNSSKLFTVLDKMGIDYSTLFLEASIDTLIRRFKETRRAHPLSEKGQENLIEAIDEEIKLLASFREFSDNIIDTSNLRANDFKDKIKRVYGDGIQDMLVSFVSFGFKHGILKDADLVFDLRCLDNPFYIKELKELTGNDIEVQNYVMNSDDSKILYKSIADFLETSLDMYRKEGRAQLVVGLGCTGGKHRSVTFANRLYDEFNLDKIEKVKRHRDIEKK